ncbi:hypothetical protein D6850_05090 [Roseovarius spongiae]|uniref:Uncharacterized protein n=1 Tax=Roseovarius spongiae TaxID=2320272 RepID=A0A3A8AY92_9RHOB|nr:hypothetical protein D6850_05090 [Roseovarius spongiae]
MFCYKIRATVGRAARSGRRVRYCLFYGIYQSVPQFLHRGDGGMIDPFCYRLGLIRSADFFGPH